MQTIAVTALSFGPLIYKGHYCYGAKDFIVQIYYRLFPFGRGLCHFIPASNFWCLYKDFIRYAFPEDLDHLFFRYDFDNYGPLQ